jgi:hypothetical protein
MTAVVQQRCLLHASREAVARCPECRNSYCRECVTEHDERLICAACLKKIGQRGVRKRALHLGAVAPLGGFLLAWFCFYMMGWLLSRIPTDLWGTG